MSNEKSWHIISTWRNYEQRLVKKFMQKDIQSFCPRYTFNFIYEGHIHTEKRLLFPSTLFLYIDASEMSGVLHTKGVNNFLYWLNRPVVVPHKDISRIYNLMNSFCNLQLQKCPVDFSHGSDPMHESDGNTVVLKVNAIGYSIIARKDYHLEKREFITDARYKLPAFTLNNSLNLASI